MIFFCVDYKEEEENRSNEDIYFRKKWLKWEIG